jgi:hypothetical protein
VGVGRSHHSRRPSLHYMTVHCRPGVTDSADERLDAPSSTADLELPPFDGPLVAFDPAPGGAPGGPVYLAGDLHRIHPAAVLQRAQPRRDECLNEARIVLVEPRGETLEVNAVEGIWCLALFGEHVDAVHYMALWDTEDRMRIWLILPPARAMIGLAHLWLRSVPPPLGGGALIASRR